MEATKVKRAKRLGLYINVGGKRDNETKNEMMNTALKTSQFVGPSVYLHARAKNIETCILPKLIYSLRHYPKAKAFMKKLNAVIINQLWLDKKTMLIKKSSTHHINKGYKFEKPTKINLDSQNDGSKKLSVL